MLSQAAREAVDVGSLSPERPPELAEKALARSEAAGNIGLEGNRDGEEDAALPVRLGGEVTNFQCNINDEDQAD